MKSLQVIEYNNQRILTTQQLADNYETDPAVISNNYNRNKERYEEGKHYYCLEGEELRSFKANHQIDDQLKFSTKLYLWTEKGALLHAKSLNTDKAWQVYDHLVESYFRAKEHQVQLQNLSPQLQLLISIETEQRVMRQQLSEFSEKAKSADVKATEVKEELQGMRDIITLDTRNWREDTSRIINKIAQKLGGNEHIRDVRTEAYKLLDKRFGVSIETRLTNLVRRMAEQGVCKSRRDKTNHLDVIAEDKKLIEGFVSIVKEMAVKHGVGKGA